MRFQILSAVRSIPMGQGIVVDFVNMIVALGLEVGKS